MVVLIRIRPAAEKKIVATGSARGSAIPRKTAKRVPVKPACMASRVNRNRISKKDMAPIWASREGIKMFFRAGRLY